MSDRRILNWAGRMVSRVPIPEPIARAIALPWLAQAKALPTMERTLHEALGTGYGSGQDAEAMQDAILYKRHPHVFSCVRVIANEYVQVPFNVQRVTTKAGKETVMPEPDHPLQKLLDNPNPFLPGWKLKYSTMAWMELAGDAFWWLHRTGPGMPKWIVPLRPDRVRIVADKETFISHYEYTVGRSKMDIPVEDIIHFSYWNPNDDYRGQGAIEAARRTVGLDWDARTFNKSVLEKGGFLGLVLQTNQKLTPASRRRISTNFTNKHAGASNARGIALLEGDWKVNEFGVSQKDMEWLDMMKFNRNEIGEVFGVPPVMLSDMDRATFNNADQQVSMFMHHTMVPKLDIIKDTLNHSRDRFFGGLSRLSDGIRFGYDLSGNWALKKEGLAQSKIETEQIKVGLKTVNEVRSDHGQEPVDGGDIRYRPIGLVPWNTPAPIRASSGSPAGESGQRAAHVEPNATKAVTVTARDLTAERQLAYWKGFIVTMDAHETALQRLFLKLLEDQRRETMRGLRRMQQNLGVDPRTIELMADEDGWLSVPLAELKRNATPAEVEQALFDLERAIEATDRTSTGLFDEMGKDGGKAGMRQAGVVDMFDTHNPLVERRILTARQRFADRVSNTTWGNLRRSLNEGIKDGESITALAGRVDDVMGVRASNALNISRTEVLSGINGGVFDGYNQSGVVKGKQWLTAGDEGVRTAHISLNGKSIALDAKFQARNRDGSIAAMLYPGDTTAPPEQTNSCRCTTSPTLKGPRDG